MGKGVVFDIKRFVQRDGPGIRTVVYLKGCPLHCPWCHNPEARRSEPELAYLLYRCIACGVCARVCPNHAVELKAGHPHILREQCVVCGNCVEACMSRALALTGAQMSVEQVMVEVRKDRSYYDQTGGGLTISGGEPTQQMDFLVELLETARAEGIHTCVETNGCTSPENLARIAPLTDLFLYDYKATGPAYRKLVGIEEKVILKNLDFLYNQGSRIVLRCPFIPSINDTPEHMQAVARLEAAYPDLAGIEVVPYQNNYTSKFEHYGYENPLPGQPPADERHIRAWRTAFESLGSRRVTFVEID